MKDFILSICRNADVIFIAGFLTMIVFYQLKTIKILEKIEKK